MKRTRVIIMLLTLIAVGAVISLSADGGEPLMILLSFPFSQIGTLLRTLSLSGTVGNIAAWLLLAAAALTPLLMYLRLRHTNRAKPSHLLLTVLSPALAWVLYKMVNPFGSLLTSTPAGLLIYKAQYGAVVYIILIGWAILRMMEYFRTARQSNLYRLLQGFVLLLAALFALSLGSSLGTLKSGLESVASANTNSGNLTVTYLFLGLHWALDALPPVLDIAAAVLALELLDAMVTDSDNQVAAAERLAAFTRVTIAVTVIAGIVFHLLQMLCMDTLRHISSNIVLPIGSLAFMLLCMTAAHIIAENKALRIENDLYI